MHGECYDALDGMDGLLTCNKLCVNDVHSVY